MIQVTAAIIFKEDKVLIAQRDGRGRQPHKWEFPGGKIEPQESPEACLKREIKEELGIDISVGQYMGESLYDYSHVTVRLLAYRATWEGGAIRLSDHEAIAWVRPDELSGFDFSPADLPFVDRISGGEPPAACPEP